jgi:hypothetical protein
MWVCDTLSPLIEPLDGGGILTNIKQFKGAFDILYTRDHKLQALQISRLKMMVYSFLNILIQSISVSICFYYP